MSGSPQITFYSHFVLLTKTRHTFRHSFYHQILFLALQRVVLGHRKKGSLTNIFRRRFRRRN